MPPTLPSQRCACGGEIKGWQASLKKLLGAAPRKGGSEACVSFPKEVTLDPKMSQPYKTQLWQKPAQQQVANIMKQTLSRGDLHPQWPKGPSWTCLVTCGEEKPPTGNQRCFCEPSIFL